MIINSPSSNRSWLAGWQASAMILSVLFTLGVAVASGQCVTGTGNPGCVHFQLRTSSAFDVYTDNPNLTTQDWLLSHLWEMQVSSITSIAG